MNTDSKLALIDQTTQAIENFAQLDPSMEVIQHPELSQLHVHGENLKRLRHKLATGELEVAVVGLEKAGKSKFSSAFVQKSGLFPSADERCTFTSTALRWGERDEARVEFYGVKEFADKVAAMLQEVECPLTDWETLDVGTFRHHFDTLAQTNEVIYEKHASKTETDIIDILEGRHKIKPLLGKGEVTLSDLHSSELKSFITDKNISRAVKNVTFYSTNLQGLENIVLYDVPGFDSPTLVHMNQTVEKLKQVDAIIMVKNIKRPSLVASEVDILIKNADSDGVKLIDKLFIFGSYADAVVQGANTPAEATQSIQKNIQTVLGDLARYLRQPFFPDRVFYGCLDSQFESILSERGLHTQTEEIKQALRQYNANERAAILDRRINRVIEDIKTVLRGIVDRTQIAIVDRSDESRPVADLLDESRRTISDDLSRYINPIKKDIEQSQRFTQRVIEQIETCIPALNDAFIEQTVHNIQASDTRNVMNTNKLNLMLRERLSAEIKDNIVNLVINLSRGDAQAIHDEIGKIIQKALGISAGHPKHDELKAAIEQFIEQSQSDTSTRDSSFRPLVERFIVDLIDTMISQPVGDESRYVRFLRGKNDLYMLAMFAPGAGLEPPFRSPLVSAVLAQKGLENTATTPRDEYLSQLQRAVPAKLKDDKTMEALVRQSMEMLADMAVYHAIPLPRVRDIVRDITQELVVEPSASGLNKLIAQLNAGLFGAADRRRGSEESHLRSFYESVRQAHNQDEVIQEIQRDLEHFVQLFKLCVVRAMNLELPFMSAITLLVEQVREAVQGALYREFIIRHVRDIRIHEFAAIDNRNARRETHGRLVKEMSDILVQLERGA